MLAGQAGLDFHATPIGPYEIELIAAPKVAGNLSALDQVQVQENGNLKPGQARPIDVPDASHEIEPLVIVAQTRTRTEAEAG